MLKKITYIILLIVLTSNISFGQARQSVMNYRKFDQKLFHFGFLLGINTSDFTTSYKPNLLKDHNLYSIQNRLQPGFQLGLIGTMKIGTPLIRLRFIPSISFQERILDYKFVSSDPEKDFELYEERIGSTSIDFPLLLKFRTKRYNNFAAFVIGGAQYTLDLQSKENTAQSFGDPFIKIYRDDFQYQVGGGVDFFFAFFKFSIELKLSHGFKQALIQDHTRVSEPINKLYNRVWLLSF